MDTPIAALTIPEVQFPKELLALGPLGMRVWCPTGIEVPMAEEVARANVPGWNLMMPKPPLDVATTDGVLPPHVPVIPDVQPFNPSEELPEDDNYDVKINPDTGEVTVTPKTPEGDRPPPPPYDPYVNWEWDEQKQTYIPAPKKTEERPGGGQGQEGREVPPKPSILPAGASEGAGDWIGFVDNSQFRWKWVVRPLAPAFAPDTANAWGGYLWKPPQQQFDRDGKLITTESGHYAWFERAGSREVNGQKQIIWYDKENNRFVSFENNTLPGLIERGERFAGDDLFPSEWGQSLVPESTETLRQQEAAKDVDFWDYLRFISGGAVFDRDLRDTMATNLQNWALSNGYTEEQLNLEGGVIENLTSLAGLSWGSLRGQGISPTDTWGKIGATIISDSLLGFAVGSPWKLATSLATAVADEIVTWRDKRSNFDKFKSLLGSMAFTVLTFKSLEYGGKVIKGSVRGVIARSAQKAIRSALRRAEVVIARKLAAYSQYLPRGAAQRIYQALGYSGPAQLRVQPLVNIDGPVASIRSVTRSYPRIPPRMQIPSNVSQAVAYKPRPFSLPPAQGADDLVFKRATELGKRLNPPQRPLSSHELNMARRAAYIRREAIRAQSWVERGQRLQRQRLEYVTFPPIAREAAAVARQRLLRQRASIVGSAIWRGGD